METVFTDITDYLLNQSWQIAILFAVVAIVCLTIRKKTAHLRYLLWLLIIAKCLVPSVITVSLAILPQKALLQPLPESAPIREFAPPPETVIMREAKSLSPPAPAPAPQPSIMAQLVQIRPKTWFSGIWLCGVGLYLLIVLIKAARFNRRLRGQRKSLGAGMQKEIDELLERFGVHAKLDIWLLDGIGQPFVWGLLRGAIYLPANFGQIGSREHRRGILMHEITHVARFDAAVNCLQTIAQAVFWFHPLVWWANRNIRAEREKCCDETAIARLSAAPKVYSSAIVDTLIAEYQSTQPIPSLAIAGPIKNIEDRIKTIMKPGKKFYNRPTLIAIITVLLLAIIAIPTTIALTHRQATKPEEFLAKDTEKVSSEFIKTLPNGVKVELVGVCRYPSEGKQWWRPDGSRLDMEIDTKDHSGYTSEDPGYEMAFKLSGQDFNFRIKDVKGSKQRSGLEVIEPEEISAFRVHIKPRLRKTSMKVGVAAGKWKTVANHTGRGTTVGIVKGFLSKKKVIFSGANETKEGVVMTVSDDLQWGIDTALFAIDENGAEHKGEIQPSLFVRDMQQQTFLFGDVLLEDIKEFQFRTRPFEWVKFKNVALRPSQKPDVQVETKESVDVEMLTTVIKVEDEEGNPIAGAVITPDGLRAEKGGGHYFWRADRHGEPPTVITNTQGLVEVAYPKYANEKIETSSISFLINHPDFCPDRPFYNIDETDKPVVLKRGATLRVSGYLESKGDLLTGIYPQLGRGRLYSDSWRQSQKGVYETHQLPPGPHYIRLAYLPEDGIAYFSDAKKFEAEKGKTYEFDLQLKPGVRLEGLLDETVPRPVRNGRVVAAAHPLNHPHHSERLRKRFTDPSVDPGYLHWRIWREVKKDGTFTFESLPHGEVELIAICDGYISKNPPEEENNYFGIAQTWPLKSPVTRAELKMKPAARCEIEVLDEQGQPVKAAQVVFSPNIQWHSGGAQIFATPFNWSDLLRAGGKMSSDKWAKVSEVADFQAISDESGIAVVPNLPEGKRHFAVLHPQYQLPAKTGYALLPSRVAEVELSAGQTAKVTVTMQKKGADFLGAEDLDTRPLSKASTSPKAVSKIPDAAKWSEGKAMMGTIATGIRAWVAENQIDGSWTDKELTHEELGFYPSDLQGTYFNHKNFSWNVAYDKSANKLTFKIRATAPEGITSPAAVTLDEKGQWEIEKPDVQVEAF